MIQYNSLRKKGFNLKIEKKINEKESITENKTMDFKSKKFL